MDLPPVHSQHAHVSLGGGSHHTSPPRDLHSLERTLTKDFIIMFKYIYYLKIHFVYATPFIFRFLVLIVTSSHPVTHEGFKNLAVEYVELVSSDML